VIADAVFLALALTVMAGAGIAVGPRNVFHNALGLGLALFGLAGVFLYLGSEFLAAMQVIIYVGAIAIAIIFAIMLSAPMWMPQDAPPLGRVLRSAAAAAAFVVLTARVLLSAPWPAAPEGGDGSIARIGELLLTRFALPFELVSLALLVAIIGAFVLSREDRRP
jgi:NADH-quinone oxidoreductase subunit J